MVVLSSRGCQARYVQVALLEGVTDSSLKLRISSGQVANEADFLA